MGVIIMACKAVKKLLGYELCVMGSCGWLWQTNKKTGFTNDVKPVNKDHLFLRTLLKYAKHSRIWNTVEQGIPSPM
jgi:hypothetical protein